MARIIEAEARISALDATGETFERVAAKVRGLTGSFKSLKGAVSSGMGAVSKNVGRIQSLVHTMAPIAGGAAAMEGMRGIHGLIHETVKSTAAQAHEAVRMSVSGMSDAEIAEAMRISGELSRKYQALSQTTIMHALRNMRAIVGTYEEAAKIIDPILKLRIAAMGAHPERSEELADDFDKLVKGMEIKGVTMDPAKFTAYMQGMAKAINVFGDTLRPTDYYEMFKYGSTAAQTLSQQFMLETAPTFAQEMGGSRTGSSLAMFYAKTVGDSMTLIAANELKKFGLIDMSKVTSKAGRITKMAPGAVKGWQTAAKDPYAWVNDVFLPALAAHGVTDKQALMGEIAMIFGSGRQSSGALVSILATQQARIQKDWALVRGAKGLSAADQFMSKDPFIAWQAVTSQFQNLLAIAGGPLAAPAAAGMNAIARGIVALEEATKKHPVLGTAGLAGGLGLLGAGSLAASYWALRGIYGLGGRLFGGGGAKAAADLSVDAATGLGAAAGPGWLASAAFSPLSLGVAMAALEANKTPGERSYFSDRGTAGSEINATPALKLYEWLTGADQLKPTGAAKPTAEVKGNADLNVTVQVEPSDSFISRIISAIENRINVFNASPGGGVGTAGSTGLSMPEAVPNP